MSLLEQKTPEEIERIKRERTVQKLGALFLSTTLSTKLSRGVFEEFLAGSFEHFLQDDRLELTMVWEKLCTVPGVQEDEVFRFFTLLLDQTFLWELEMPTMFHLRLGQKSLVEEPSALQKRGLEGWSTAEVKRVRKSPGSRRGEQTPLPKAGPASERGRAETPGAIEVLSTTGNHETIARLRKKRAAQGGAAPSSPQARSAPRQREAPEKRASKKPTTSERSSTPMYNKTKLPPRRKAPEPTGEQTKASTPKPTPKPAIIEKPVEAKSVPAPTPEPAPKPKANGYTWQHSEIGKGKGTNKDKPKKPKKAQKAQKEAKEQAPQKQWVLLAVLGVVLLLALWLNL